MVSYLQEPGHWGAGPALGKHWVNTLASLPLLATRELTAGQMRDIGMIPDLLTLVSLTAPWSRIDSIKLQWPHQLVRSM
jgi:hypothetical protein